MLEIIAKHIRKPALLGLCLASSLLAPHLASAQEVVASEGTWMALWVESCEGAETPAVTATAGPTDLASLAGIALPPSLDDAESCIGWLVLVPLPEGGDSRLQDAAVWSNSLDTGMLPSEQP